MKTILDLPQVALHAVCEYLCGDDIALLNLRATHRLLEPPAVAALRVKILSEDSLINLAIGDLRVPIDKERLESGYWVSKIQEARFLTGDVEHCSQGLARLLELNLQQKFQISFEKSIDTDKPGFEQMFQGLNSLGPHKVDVHLNLRIMTGSPLVLGSMFSSLKLSATDSSLPQIRSAMRDGSCKLDLTVDDLFKLPVVLRRFDSFQLSHLQLFKYTVPVRINGGGEFGPKSLDVEKLSFINCTCEDREAAYEAQQYCSEVDCSAKEVNFIRSDTTVLQSFNFKEVTSFRYEENDVGRYDCGYDDVGYNVLKVLKQSKNTIKHLYLSQICPVFPLVQSIKKLKNLETVTADFVVDRDTLTGQYIFDKEHGYVESLIRGCPNIRYICFKQRGGKSSATTYTSARIARLRKKIGYEDPTKPAIMDDGDFLAALGWE